MAAPNIVNVSTILGRTAMVQLTNSTATQVLANGASSNKVLKLGGILATNTEGTSVNVAFNLYITRSGTDFYLARNVTIPALASYEALVKDGTPIYLEEGDTLMAKSENASGHIHVVAAYEDIS